MKKPPEPRIAPIRSLLASLGSKKASFPPIMTITCKVNEKWRQLDASSLEELEELLIWSVMEASDCEWCIAVHWTRFNWIIDELEPMKSITRSEMPNFDPWSESLKVLEAAQRRDALL